MTLGPPLVIIRTGLLIAELGWLIKATTGAEYHSHLAKWFVGEVPYFDGTSLTATPQLTHPASFLRRCSRSRRGWYCSVRHGGGQNSLR